MRLVTSVGSGAADEIPCTEILSTAQRGVLISEDGLEAREASVAPYQPSYMSSKSFVTCSKIARRLREPSVEK